MKLLETVQTHLESPNEKVRSHIKPYNMFNQDFCSSRKDNSA